jgi:methionine synthase II (cobalamin-independent)
VTTATGVGSHPGEASRDFDEAVRVAWGEVGELPYVPEVPGRGAHADMAGRALALLVDLAADLQPAGWRLTGAPGRDHRRAVSLLAQDLDAVEEHAQGYTGPVKLQVAGPWTLAALVERPRGDRVLADLGARRDLAQSLAAGVAGHVSDVRRRIPGATRLLVQVDEPALPAVLTGGIPTASGFHRHRSVDAPLAAPALEWVLTAAREAGAETTVHCCAAAPPLDLLAKAGGPGLGVDLDVLDAAAYDALATALEGGRSVHLGVVPSTRPAVAPTASAVTGRVERFLDLVGASPTDSLVLTPACGLAGADAAWARQALALVREAGRMLDGREPAPTGRQ